MNNARNDSSDSAKKCVWIVNHYATVPSQSASGSRHFSLGKELVGDGWEVVILAASAEHNSGRQRLGRGQRRSTEVRDGITFRWLRTSTYVGNGIGRVWSIIQFTSRLLLRHGTSGLPQPSVVIGSTVHPLAAWAASLIAHRKSVPFVFEIRDLWPETLIDMGKLRRRGLPATLLRKLEKHLCARASTVITLMPRAYEYLESRGVPQNKVMWVSNGVDVGSFPVEPQPDRGPFTFMYFGAHGTANGVEAILEAFARYRLDPAYAGESRLVLVGDGPRKPRLVALAKELRVEDYTEFWEPVPRDSIPVIAGKANVLILNLLDLPLYKYGISLNKLFDYMASSRFIIMATNAAANPLLASESGRCVSANDVDALLKSMQVAEELTQSERDKHGQRARDYVESHFDYSTLARRLDVTLTRVLEEQGYQR